MQHCLCSRFSFLFLSILDCFLFFFFFARFYFFIFLPHSMHYFNDVFFSSLEWMPQIWHGLACSLLIVLRMLKLFFGILFHAVLMWFWEIKQIHNLILNLLFIQAWLKVIDWPHKNYSQQLSVANLEITSDKEWIRKRLIELQYLQPFWDERTAAAVIISSNCLWKVNGYNLIPPFFAWLMIWRCDVRREIFAVFEDKLCCFVNFCQVEKKNIFALFIEINFQNDHPGKKRKKTVFLN